MSNDFRDQGLGIYVHVPFCTTRCAYCDFAIVTGQDERRDEYVLALARELAALAPLLEGRRACSVHLGGGTPSKLTPAHVRRVLALVREAIPCEPEAEIGLEANPEDIDGASVDAWLEAGVTRVTIGVQALDDEGLRSLGRPGDADRALAALGEARRGGVPSLGADFIFGRPGQSENAWDRELAQIVALDVDHLSLYALETDAPTPLVRAMERGTVARDDPDAAAAMYERSVAALAAGGFDRYEISNFAKPTHESRHNLLYWTDGAYLGIGPSAASYVDGRRWTNPRRFGEWMRRAHEASLHDTVEDYDPRVRVGEALIFGLRLDRGVDLAALARRHGFAAVDEKRSLLESFAERGLVEFVAEDRCRLTERARLIAHEIFVDLI